jgi:hypothetical protein
MPCTISCHNAHAIHIGSDPETIDTGTIPSRYEGILENKTLLLQGKYRINYDMDRDMLWRWDQVLPVRTISSRQQMQTEPKSSFLPYMNVSICRHIRIRDADALVDPPQWNAVLGVRRTGRLARHE